MNFIDTLIFLQSYSLPTVVIALTVAVIFYVLNVIFKDKIPDFVNTFLPPICCLLFYFLFDVLFISRGFIFKVETLSAGIICASLCFLLSALIDKIHAVVTKGSFSDVDFSPEKLAVSEVIDDYVAINDLSAVTDKIISILSAFDFTLSDADEQSLINEISNVIIANALKNNSEIELLALAKTIITTYKAIKNL